MKKYIYCLRGILLILILATTFTIFGFSNQNSEKSSGLSRKIATIITNKIPNINEEKKEAILNQVERIIRKIAHFSIYTLLGFLLISFFNTFILKEKIQIISSFSIGILYAISDEIHQLFVVGRNGRITDIWIDTLGVFFGISFFLLLWKVRKKLYKFIKRIFDILFSIIALIITIPITIVVSILIKKDSKGKVIFTQKRLGKNDKEFEIYKFRTMIEDAENKKDEFTEKQKEIYQRNFKLEDDPRTTKIGKLLRKTCIDEIPQFINVLKGEMSLIGPRPIVKEEIKKYGNNKNQLLSIRPGIIGYWQVYCTKDTTYEERMKMELEYVEKESFVLDVKIFFKSIITIINRCLQKGNGNIDTISK